jgi:DNA topoisomerase-1
MTERRMWKRVGTSPGDFVYIAANGREITNEAALRRIRKLAIPPGWRDVLVDPSPMAKIQAIGYDAAGRKQYRYHPEFVSRRANRKFRRMLPFARSLPVLRARTNEHLKSEDLGQEQVLATVVRLMYRAFFRIGSERYAVQNKTFGIATLQKHHLTIQGTNLVFQYIGKKQVHQRRVVADTPLVEIVEKILELPGDRLFRYRLPDGEVRDVTASDVNSYLRRVLEGERYTSKDIRTWGGTVRAATILADFGAAESRREAEKNIVLACKLVSTELGNTPAICRNAYIHPAVLENYLVGETIERVMRKTPRPVEAQASVQLYPEEAALMRMLEGVESSPPRKRRKRPAKQKAKTR